jgi:DNA-binding LytR/AlgR family response regulator
MNTLIIDDNIIARTTVKQLANRVADISIIAECTDALEAYSLILKHQIDLLLLDIEMPGMTGLELIQNLGNNCPVIIFVTSKKQYAVEAFDLHVADYVLKPINVARFLQAVDKARKILESKREVERLKEDQFLFIRDSYNIRRVELDNILFAEAMGDYVKLHTTEKILSVHSTLKSVEERLPAFRFIRVHRSYLVAIDKIDAIEEGGKVLVINGKLVPIADAYRSLLNKRMNIL